MSQQRIRILDHENDLVTVTLNDIFTEVRDGESFYWAILYLYATGDLGKEYQCQPLKPV